MDAEKPPIVVEAQRRIREYNRKVLAPFVAFGVVGGVVGVPAGVHLGEALTASGGAAAFFTIALYLGVLFALMVPLIKKGNELAWATPVLQQWQAHEAGLSLLPEGPPVGAGGDRTSAEADAARNMAGRIRALVAADHQAEEAAGLAAERAGALAAERAALAESRAALPEGSEGAAALGAAEAAVQAELQRILDELASLYAALVAERAGAPPAAEAELGDAIDRVQARAEVAQALLQRQRKG